MAEYIVLSRMGYKSKKQGKVYTDSEVEFIKRNFDRMSYRQMAEHLVTPQTNICVFCSKLGLGKKKHIDSSCEDVTEKVDIFDVYACREKTWIV
ncbi:hypothetical protein UFOVP153_17 [uncultured Caudovirales phage]|uniref:Uncharacterized protein n=1 Tax=uncultured Caudovirales phage TaxID=2100421 RepID=A0A6J7WFJ6_9CAUD|nr:hypothetical protein UFOVP69_41 [uncultured Caudovirales phage]CAB5170380.1 hypothetical protein UFOVP153_17 [uncultured Caudovirales phage]